MIPVKRSNANYKRKPASLPKVVIPTSSNISAPLDFSSSADSRKQSRDLLQNYVTGSIETNPANDLIPSMERMKLNSFSSSDIKSSARKPRPFIPRIDTASQTDQKNSDFPNLSIFSSSVDRHVPTLEIGRNEPSAPQSQPQSPAPFAFHSQPEKKAPSPSPRPSIDKDWASKPPNSLAIPNKKRLIPKPRRQLETGSDTNAFDSDPELVGDEFVLNENTTEILSKLGEGAVGTSVDVYPDETNHRQLLRELSFLKYCNSPYIVKFYGASFITNEDGQSIYMYMEYCDAGSLDTIYKKVGSMNGRIGEGVLGKVAESVLNGLVYLHKNRIIHRDIKPSNILVTGSGQIKLCDFGVSGELVDSIAQTFVGTSYYMAPERIQGAGYAVTSDVWSLGLTLLEIAQNRFPFPPEGTPRLTIIELLDYIVRVPIPSLPESQFSQDIINFMDICLIKSPKERPTPYKLLEHPFIVKSQQNVLDLKSWIRHILSS